MKFQRVKVLIWGKTYPELSFKYVETVCTGGVLEDGSPIRLYPVPLRYLDSNARYRLYDWISVPIVKSTQDPRPESYKVDAENIVRVGQLSPDKDGWQARREAVFQDPSWQFASVGDLKKSQDATGQSMGIVTPGSIADVRLVERSLEERDQYEQKMREVQSQSDFFRPEYKELNFLTHDLRMRWRCEEPCKECARSPHDMKALDWGLLELARRKGWSAAKDKLETISNLREYDFKLFMGNFRLRLHVFGIIGMWYPKIPAQHSLL